MNKIAGVISELSKLLPRADSVMQVAAYKHKQTVEFGDGIVINASQLEDWGGLGEELVLTA